MSYNINSQMVSNNNVLQSNIAGTNFSAKEISRFVEAPEYLPKFSITQSLNERDEFRKNVIKTNYQTKERKKISKLLTFALIGIATAFGYKKLIK